MEYKKKLIEVALPLEAINAESAREKSIRHGHPSTLHLWWARRPLAAARAVIWSSLVDDPSSHPDEFPTEEAQTVERERLFGILERLVKWENTNNQDVLAEAKAEIMKSTDGNPPALLDPFAGGGAIPLEAQRLGLKAYASDLNPVAVMINKAMIEIPPKFAGQPPVNPESRRLINDMWTGASGLAEDVRYYGEWMKKKAFEKIGHLYPKVKDEHGQEHTVIAWIWARTVKCPNPACGCEMPLASSFVLSKKKDHEAWVEPIVTNGEITFHVHQGKCPQQKETNKMGRSALFQCPVCGEITTDAYVKENGKGNKIGARLMAIVAEDNRQRIYLSPKHEDEIKAMVGKPEHSLEGAMSKNPRWFSPPAFGMTEYMDLFTNRQLTALTTFSDLVAETQSQIEKEGGTSEYSQAIGVYLSFVVDKSTDIQSSISTWINTLGAVRNTFARQAIPMTWDYVEANPFSNSTGCWGNMLNWVVKSVEKLPATFLGSVQQRDAQSDCDLRDIMISTDPPYYDNIGYADLSDFFYIWMRRMLKNIYPDLFKTMLVPKAEELVATPYRFDGNFKKAKRFFEYGMLKTFCQINKCAHSDIPVTVYYAFKQSDTDGKETTASTGWETMLSAIIQAGFVITGTWPIRTEREVRTIASGTNALSSSIVLVCRKRSADAPLCTRREFINTLKRELKPALHNLQASNIAPVDLAQSAIGPGMGVYSCFSKVLEADGTPMSVRSALQIINQELDLYFAEQDGELDRDSRFCVDLYTQYAFNAVKFGEADVLARAKNTSVEKLEERGVLYAQKGVVRLLTRPEITTTAKDSASMLWLCTQQLTRALEEDGVTGVAKIVAGFTAEPENAKALAYRLFTIAERKGWAAEAYAYNTLVIAWPEVQAKVVDLQATGNRVETTTLFDVQEGQ